MGLFRCGRGELRRLDAGWRLGRKGDPDLVQQSLDVRLRLGVARQHQPAPIEHGNPDLDHLNGGELFEYGCRRQTGRVNEEPVFEGDLKTVREERNDRRRGELFDSALR